MTYDEMNAFILNYIKNDITCRAIMLTGKWGSGKSYYVKNNLKPFLEDKDNGKHKCVIVSLYGLSDISEISRAIYMELRTIKKSQTSETGSTAKAVGKIVGKTIFNGLVSKIGFDIGSIEDKDLQEIYESVDLTDKLIVLEDIERTQIDIIELLGYINNMCENDGVKVLLVTNESELLNYHIEENVITEYGKEKTVSKKVYSEKAQKYLKAKEKSISDTLQFYADFQQTINSIIEKFENDDLSSFKGCLETPTRSIIRTDITNYREVIVACQKACDIYNYMETHRISANKEFKKCILIGLIYYLQKRVYNPDLNFKDKTVFDSNLSENDIYPLMRFCYDYYNFQIISQEEIKKTIEEYDNYIIYIDKTGYDDKDLKVLYASYLSSERDVNKAINSIFIRLDNIEDISLNHYDRIIYNLLFLKYDVQLYNENIDKIIAKIIENLKGKGSKFDKINLFSSSEIVIQNTEGIEEFNDIHNKVLESLNYTPEIPPIQYKTDYYEIIDMINNRVNQCYPTKLMEKLPLDEVINYIAKFNIETIRNLLNILSNSNYSRLSNDTLTSIQTFKNGIEEILQQSDTSLDCIQKFNLRLICKAIDRNIANNNN